MKYSEYLASRRNASKDKERQLQHMNDVMALWRDTAVAVAGSSNCKDRDIPGRWASKAVADYLEFCEKSGWPGGERV